MESGHTSIFFSYLIFNNDKQAGDFTCADPFVPKLTC